jgi:hypothetical protein
MIDIAVLIDAHSLQFRALPAEFNPVMPQDSDDMVHWFCTLSGGPISGFDFYISLGQVFEGAPPSSELALTLLLEDVRAYKECEGYEDFARLLGIEDDDAEGQAQGYAAYEELSKLSPLMDEVLELENPSPAPVR